MQKNGLTEIKSKSNSTLLLPYSGTKINYWIANDSRSLKEKAVIMFLNGSKEKYISEKLNIKTQKISAWISRSYENELETHTKNTKKNTPFITPDNFSTWNSLKIYDFWNRFNSRQNSK